MEREIDAEALLTVLSEANSIQLPPFVFDMPADLLVRPNQRVLVLFKYVGLVRSFQVFQPLV